MAKAAVLLEDHYQVLEVWYPYLNLSGLGVDTVFVGTGRKQEFESKNGYPAKAEMSINDVNPDDFDGVIIPGGYAPDLLRRVPEVISFVRDLFMKDKLVAAICHAGWVPASAGILKDKKATCFSAIKDDVVNAGAEYLDEEVVVDGNLITSRNPYDLPAFCREIISFFESNNVL